MSRQRNSQHILSKEMVIGRSTPVPSIKKQTCTAAERVQAGRARYARQQQYWVYQRKKARIEADIDCIENRLVVLRQHKLAYLDQRHQHTVRLSAMADDPESEGTAAFLETDQSLAWKIILSTTHISDAKRELGKAEEKLKIISVDYEKLKAEFGGGGPVQAKVIKGG